MTPLVLLPSGSKSESPSSGTSGPSGLMATNAEKHSLPFGAFASPMLGVLEKWLLLWQVVTAAEWGIWGWGCGALWCWLGACTATICLPHRRDMGPVTTGECAAKSTLFLLWKGRCAFPQLAMGLTTAACWQDVVLWGCHVPAPSAILVCVEEKEVPFPGNVWQGLPVRMREGLGQTWRWLAE